MINVGSWWRIECMGDHYACVKNGRLIGTVERTSDDQWGWYPLGSGTLMEYVTLRFALQEARKAAETESL